MNDKNVFKPRARIILQLGDQLIKNESIALLELVKNSYDAGATNVDIQMFKINNNKEGFISIKDNGCGMSNEIIRNVWLEPGSDYKVYLKKQFKGKKKKFNRRPLGEKGIGRFGAHKLGKSVELVSRMKNEKEIYVKIDWTVFDKHKYLDEVPIDIVVRKPEIFTGKQTGTLIKMYNLRPKQWSVKISRELYRSLNTISSPFETPDSFKVSFKTDTPNDFANIPTIEDIRDRALYRFNCEIKNDKITSFSYIFKPYKSMIKLSERKLFYNVEGKKNNIKEFNKINKMFDRTVRNSKKDTKESPPINLSANGMKIGTVKFEGLIFDRQSKVLKHALTDSKAIKTYLDQNGGVRLYRDGIRVYDYGEQENDWLGLEKKRLYDPGVRVNKGLMLAAVHLNGEESADLVEKTNREGFIDNESYRTLRDAVLYAIRIVESYRNEDKDKVRDYYGLSPKSEPVLANIAEMKEVIEKKIQDEKTQKECLRYLDAIEKEYEAINEILLTSAAAGLNLSVAIHEIEKIASELEKVVRDEKSSTRVLKLIEHLAELIEMYGTLVKKSKSKTIDLKTLVNDSLFSVKYRLNAHKVKIIDKYSIFKGASEIKCSSRLVIGSILNLVDNSIYWLDRYKIKNKKILILIKKKLPKHVELIVADNGKGFALPPAQMIKPFVSLKPGGMGLGLHIASEVMMAQGGTIEFRDQDYSKTNLPREFAKGAIVSLVFKKG